MQKLLIKFCENLNFHIKQCYLSLVVFFPVCNHQSNFVFSAFMGDADAGQNFQKIQFNFR